MKVRENTQLLRLEIEGLGLRVVDFGSQVYGSEHRVYGGLGYRF